jgi:hypothetical protein
MQDDSLEALRQQVANADAAAQATNTAMMTASVTGGWDKSTVLILSISVLVFGLATMWIMMQLLKTHANSPVLLPAFALPLVVVSAIFLVVTGYSQEQIAPVVGLLGSIVGYILGKSDRRSSQAPAPPKSEEPLPRSQPTTPH